MSQRSTTAPFLRNDDRILRNVEMCGGAERRKVTRRGRRNTIRRERPPFGGGGGMLRLMVAVCVLLAALASSATAEGEVSGIRDRRYCEVFVVRRTGLKLEADVYNTLGLNDCPQAQWAAIDPAKLKNERDAFTIVMDGIVIERRAQSPADFQGLMMNLVGVLHIPWRDLADRRPYTEHTVSRRTRFTFDAGEPVYELISPSGDVYVMQSYSEIVDP